MGRLTKAQVQQKLNAANKENGEKDSLIEGLCTSTIIMALVLIGIGVYHFIAEDEVVSDDCFLQVQKATEDLETKNANLQSDFNRIEYSFRSIASSNRQLLYFIDTLADKSRPYHDEATTKMTHYVNQKNTFAYGNAVERRELLLDIKKDFDCNDEDGYGCPVVDALLSCETDGEEDADETRAECFINTVLEDKTYSNSY